MSYKTNLLVSTALALLLAGCPATELVCNAGFHPEGDVCVADPGTDAGQDAESDVVPDVPEADVPVDAGPCNGGCDSGKQCRTSDDMCVTCLLDSECDTAAAAKCGDDGECTACDDSMHCAGIERTAVCAEAGERTGQCVECAPATEVADCAGGDSCDPATNACSGIERGIRRQCEACVSDSDCGEEQGQCVPLSYMAELRGGFCLRPVSDICANPFRETFAAVSLSGGDEADYCGIKQNEVSCEAVRALLDDVGCEAATVTADCGDGAICATVGGIPNKCTYACIGASECPSGCNTHCGG